MNMSEIEDSIREIALMHLDTPEKRRARSWLLQRMENGRRGRLMVGGSAKYNARMSELLEPHTALASLLEFDERGVKWCDDVSAEVYRQIGAFIRENFPGRRSRVYFPEAPA